MCYKEEQLTVRQGKIRKFKFFYAKAATQDKIPKAS